MIEKRHLLLMLQDYKEAVFLSRLLNIAIRFWMMSIERKLESIVLLE